METDSFISQLGTQAGKLRPWKMLQSPLATQLGKITGNPAVRNAIPRIMAPVIQSTGAPGIIGTSLLRNMGAWKELTRGPGGLGA